MGIREQIAKILRQYSPDDAGKLIRKMAKNEGVTCAEDLPLPMVVKILLDTEGSGENGGDEEPPKEEASPPEEAAEPEPPEPEKPKSRLDGVVESLRIMGLAYLVGPAGTGKTTLALQACEKIYGKIDGNNFAQISFSPDTTAGEMVGRCDVNGKYHPSEIVRIFRDGGLVLFDEIDNADASMLVKLNTALANGIIATPEGMVKRHEKTVIVCTANTYGTGPDAMYVGRTRLDASTLDRFACAQIEVDYDTGLERQILTEAKLPAKTVAAVVSFVGRARQHIAAQKLRRLVSTRWVIGAAKWLAAGKTLSEVKEMAVMGWSDKEKGGLI